MKLFKGLTISIGLPYEFIARTIDLSLVASCGRTILFEALEITTCYDAKTHDFYYFLTLRGADYFFM